MSNPFDEISAAVSRARELNRAVSQQASTLADLLQPHLKSVTHYRLRDLKRQLELYNTRTGKWKKES